MIRRAEPPTADKHGGKSDEGAATRRGRGSMQATIYVAHNDTYSIRSPHVHRRALLLCVIIRTKPKILYDGNMSMICCLLYQS